MFFTYKYTITWTIRVHLVHLDTFPYFSSTIYGPFANINK